MTTFCPKYITFDCHGTLINFQMAEAAHDLYGDASGQAPAMAGTSSGTSRPTSSTRFWAPGSPTPKWSTIALERTCKRNGVAFQDEDAQMVYERVPTWGPHPDVPAGLAKVAKEIPLVILPTR